MNGSFYSAYGYSAAGRLGTTSSNKADIVAKMNEKTLQACANAKAGGHPDLHGRLLRDRRDGARHPAAMRHQTQSMALVADSDQALTNAFDEIGNHISRLRLIN
jgi:hypothetical protein